MVEVEETRIAFLGLFGQGNFGNDCTLEAIVHHVRKSVATERMKCICTGPDQINTRIGIQTFPMRIVSGNGSRSKAMIMGRLGRILTRVAMECAHWARAMMFLKGTNILVVPGTGLLVDHTCGFRGYPYDIFKWSVLAKLLRCKVLIMSIGAGPILHPVSRWLIRSALSSADYRSYRDSYSKQYIQSIGLETAMDPVYPDLAFSMPATRIPIDCKNAENKIAVGVGLVDYQGPIAGKDSGEGDASYREYLNTTASFIAWLLKRKYTVHVLIGDFRYDSDVRRDLMKTLGERGLANGEGRLVSETISSSEELLEQIAKTDMVITPRFHNIILALMQNKPVIALSHDEKFNSLMKGLGLQEYCLPICGLEVTRLIEMFKSLEIHAENIKVQIRNETEEYRRALDRQYSEVFHAGERQC